MNIIKWFIIASIIISNQIIADESFNKFNSKYDLLNFFELQQIESYGN